MADLLSGRYDDVISSFRLIDCRYPYEFEGGHVMVGQKQSNFQIHVMHSAIHITYILAIIVHY